MAKNQSKKYSSNNDLNSFHDLEKPVFNWTPLPQKRTLKSSISLDQISESKCNENPNFYPNCDVNVWLRSCENEITEPLSGITTGNIPLWLNGNLIRNGPGSLKVGKETFKHLFDSSALLHRFSINNGKVTYQCRFLQSEIYKKNNQAQRIVVTDFGTRAVLDPCHTIFDRVSTMFNAKEQSDNSMISVYPFGDELYAFGETPIIHKINPETLETDGRLDLSDHIAIVNHTSHPHVLKNGNVYNLALSARLTERPKHVIVCFKNNKNNKSGNENMFESAQKVAEIKARWPLHPCYMHTFGITKNYYIIVEQPLTVSVPDIITLKFKNEPLIGAFKWYPEHYTQFNIVSRETGQIDQIYFAEAFFYLHIINQYEYKDYLIIDICCYRDPAMIECMYIDLMKNMQNNPDYAKMFRGRPLRFVLPLKITKKRGNLINLPHCKAKAHYESGKIMLKPEKLCDLGCETPRINYEEYLGRKYRYFYAISSDVDANNPGTIIKVDTLKKSCITWCEDNCYPSEPIFVATPGANREDTGVLLTALVWGKNFENKVGLLILDARTLTEIGRCVFQTNTPIPKCLHGWFLKD